MDAFTVSPATFARQMRWIAARGWKPVPLNEIIGGRLDYCPDRALAITFDDGFACNREYAWPVLRTFGFPAATFLVTDRLGQCNDWDAPSDPRYSLLARAELAEADAAMSFHSHSSTHAELPQLIEPASLRAELDGPRAALAEVPNSGNIFAYPFGSWTWDVRLAVEKAGYDAACTCLEGLNSRTTDRFLLRRVEIREADIGVRLEAKLRTGRDVLRWPPARPAWLTVALARARRRGGPLASRHP